MRKTPAVIVTREKTVGELRLANQAHKKRSKNDFNNDDITPPISQPIIPYSHKQRPIHISSKERRKINDESFNNLIQQFRHLRSLERDADRGNEYSSERRLHKLFTVAIKKSTILKSIEEQTLYEKTRKRLLEQMITSQNHRISLDHILTAEEIRRRDILHRFLKSTLWIVKEYRARLETVELPKSMEMELKEADQSRTFVTNPNQQFNSFVEVVMFVGNLRKKGLWNDVRKCRYLRGFDPEIMTLPSHKTVTEFVFEKD